MKRLLMAGQSRGIFSLIVGLRPVLVLQLAMRRKLPPISDAEWQNAQNAYELGHRSGRQIAQHLGVSPATVCRRFRLLGAVKACRVGEAMQPVIAEMDRLAAERVAREAAEWDAALARSEELRVLMDQMIGAIFAADRVGSVTLAAGRIADTKAAVLAR
ncbi:MAG: hypothetical protein WA842_13370 [Croceibacterium sp.]